MNISTDNTFNEAHYANLKTTLPPADYEAFISFKKREKEMDEFKAQQRLEQRKKDAGQDYYNRKDTLIVREVRKQNREHEFVTADKVFAFCDVHKMKKNEAKKNGTYSKGDKFEVSDQEIEAFTSLEEQGQFYKDITLEMVEKKVEEIKAAEEESKQDETGDAGTDDVKVDEGSSDNGIAE